MKNIAANTYLSEIGSTCIISFHDTKVKDFLTENKVGNKYYVMFEEYKDDIHYGYTVRPATFVKIESNHKTGTNEFIFKYENAIFPYLDEYALPEFSHKIHEGNTLYTLYSHI